jgi:hypothetical protein
MDQNRLESTASAQPVWRLLTMSEAALLSQVFEHNSDGGDTDSAKVREIWEWAKATRLTSITIEAAFAGRVSFTFNKGNFAATLVTPASTPGSRSPKLAVDHFPPLTADEQCEFESLRERIAADSLSQREFHRFAALQDRVQVGVFFNDHHHRVPVRRGGGHAKIAPRQPVNPPAEGKRLLSRNELLLLCAAIGRPFTEFETKFLSDLATGNRVNQMYLDATLRGEFIVRFRKNGSLGFKPAPAQLPQTPPATIDEAGFEECAPSFSTPSLKDFPPLGDAEWHDYNLLSERGLNQGADALSVLELARHIELEDRVKVQAMLAD